MDDSERAPALIRSLVIASHNTGKVREIAALLAPYGVAVRSAAELGLADPEETGTTYAENAALKARAATEATGLPALADDSGLSVAALDGAPGIYSARWAGEPRDFAAAMARVKDELDARGADDHSAAFVCVLALAVPRGLDAGEGDEGDEGGCDVALYEGRVEGRLTFPPRGDRGFGYDPIFVAEGERETFGEMDPAKKYAMSHRARAFEKLVAARFAS